MKRVAIVAIALLVSLFFYKSNYEVPILMYHHVGDPSEKSSINISTETFERQMEFLKVHRFHVLTLEDLIGHIRLGQHLPWNSVAITFDDGNGDNFKNAFPILKKMGFPATIFMITGNIGKDHWMNEEDLRVLDSAGIEIGSHTANHAFLPDLRKEEIVLELRQSRNRLEKILGHPIFLFSYPAGGVTQEAKKLVSQEGYRGAVTTNYGKRIHDPYALHRIKATDANGNLFNFWLKVSGIYHLGKKRIDIE